MRSFLPQKGINLLTTIGTITSTMVTNLSAVVGATVTAALNTLNTAVSTAQSTANTASTNATTALNEISAFEGVWQSAAFPSAANTAILTSLRIPVPIKATVTKIRVSFIGFGGVGDVLDDSITVEAYDSTGVTLMTNSAVTCAVGSYGAWSSTPTANNAVDPAVIGTSSIVIKMTSNNTTPGQLMIDVCFTPDP